MKIYNSLPKSPTAILSGSRTHLKRKFQSEASSNHEIQLNKLRTEVVPGLPGNYQGEFSNTNRAIEDIFGSIANIFLTHTSLMSRARILQYREGIQSLKNFADGIQYEIGASHAEALEEWQRVAQIVGIN